MDKLTERCLTALLEREGLEPKEGDLERFGPLIDKYIETLKTLNSVDVAGEEIAGTFRPEAK
jgi:hypothetical protein